MAFVDPAADPEYIFYAYKRYNYTQKDPNFVAGSLQRCNR